VLPLQSHPGGVEAVYFQVTTFAPVRHQGAQGVSRMGITGLLQLLAAAQFMVGDFWKECRNKRCAFDGHVWLHTFCLVHFEDVSQPEPVYRPVFHSFVSREIPLLGKGMHVTIVLDGQRMPSKHGTDDERTRKRAKKYAEAYDASKTSAETDTPGEILPGSATGFGNTSLQYFH
jgi:hypothetical protein